MAYIVAKGYVCLDGTSLTVVSVNRTLRSFSVMLIKYTQEHIIMPLKVIGSCVNLEVDQVGKYVESIVVGMLLGGKEPAVTNNSSKSLLENIVSDMVDAKLAEIMKK